MRDTSPLPKPAGKTGRPICADRQDPGWYFGTPYADLDLWAQGAADLQGAARLLHQAAPADDADLVLGRAARRVLYP